MVFAHRFSDFFSVIMSFISIHRLKYNPVEAGFVQEPQHWKYGSAVDYAGGKGLLEIDYL